MNPISALQQALTMVGQGVGNTVQQGFRQVGNTVNQAIENFPLEFGGAERPAPQPMEPVRTRPRARMSQVQTLLKNTVDQTPYTPQAESFIKNLNYHVYGNRPMSNQTYDMTGGYYNPGEDGGHVSINSGTLAKGRDGGAVDVMRHELIHAMDQAVNSNSGELFNSAKFLELLKRLNPEFAKMILRGSMNSEIYDPKDQVSRNTEASAYYGENPQLVLWDDPELFQKFSQIYRPMTKAQYYSPVYMSPEAAGALWELQNPEEGEE